MPRADDLHGQIQLACQHFHSRIGLPLTRYETAEILTHDQTWEPWNDLPIRLKIGPGPPVCVSWSETSELWIDAGSALPFPATGEGYQYRWVVNVRPALEPLRGCALRAVYLGCIEDPWVFKAYMPSWRLLLGFDRGWLEVFNAMDENGYAVHAARPDGEWVRCA